MENYWKYQSFPRCKFKGPGFRVESRNHIMKASIFKVTIRLQTTQWNLWWLISSKAIQLWCVFWIPRQSVRWSECVAVVIDFQMVLKSFDFLTFSKTFHPKAPRQWFDEHPQGWRGFLMGAHQLCAWGPILWWSGREVPLWYQNIEVTIRYPTILKKRNVYRIPYINLNQS